MSETAHETRRERAPAARFVETASRFDATITGRKGFQSETRAGLPRFELDRSDAADLTARPTAAAWLRRAAVVHR